ncbi:sensor histidine kinase [Algoriphagus sp.]|uniref:tetratricopeptide repeat-containing sensor histidine kinase n=1 Tax=Algoriphagus sp. TaxID=1872435 RepID=UPI00261DA595|nr:sensor histidine kinase [Algoriphagus sp.]
MKKSSSFRKGKAILALLAFVFHSNYIFGQGAKILIDSLRAQVTEPMSDEKLANLYGELGWQYAAFNLDSAIYFGKLAVETAHKTDNPGILAQAYSDLGSGFLQKGELEEGRKMYTQALDIRQQLGDSLGMAKVFIALGFVYQKTYESDSAISSFLRALPIFEKENDLLSVATIKSNLGVIYQNLSRFEDAIQVYQESVAIREELGDYRSLVGTYNNMGSSYKYLKDFDQAEAYFQKALSLAKELGEPMSLAISHRVYAIFLQELGEMKALEEVSRSGLEVARSINAGYEEATLEFALGVSLNAQGSFDEAKAHLLNSAASFQSQGAEEDVLGPFFELISLYAAQGIPDSSRYYANRYIELQRQKIEKESRELTAELDTRYQTELKDLQIAEQELEIQNKNLQIFGSLILALILAVVGYLLYYQQRLRNQQIRQESALKTALAKIETQNKLNEQRMLIARDLHDTIGAQLTFIISSIENLNYFEPIKETLTQRYRAIADFTRQTITELRDTIWAMNQGKVSWESLFVRVQDYLKKAKEIVEMDITLTVAPNFPSKSELNSSDSLHVLRIIQEAVQNAIKYAQASAIKINLTGNEVHFELSISDNGLGFDESQIQAGHGLYNMRKRAEELGGNLEIISKPKAGTQVILSK